MNDTAFYVVGIALVLVALGVSFIGLRFENFPPSRGVMFAGIALFVLLVGGATTFAWRNAEDEQQVRNQEQAEGKIPTPSEVKASEASGESVSQEEQAAGTTPSGGTQTTTTSTPSGGGEVLKLTSPANGGLSFDPSKLTAQKPGEVTLQYDNPSPVAHSIAIAKGSQELVSSQAASADTLEATADLKPGKYTYYCSVPGHREAGMEGTLTVK